jgi:hypothetical protein
VVKQILKEFIDVLEQAHLHRGPCGSPFEHRLPPLVVAWADAALEVALSSEHPVVLLTRMVPTRAVVSGLVLLRAGVNIKSVYSGDLDEEDFQRLASWLARMSKANFEIAESWPARLKSMAAHLTRGTYVFVC